MDASRQKLLDYLRYPGFVACALYGQEGLSGFQRAQFRSITVPTGKCVESLHHTANDMDVRVIHIATWIDSSFHSDFHRNLCACGSEQKRIFVAMVGSVKLPCSQTIFSRDN